MFNIEFYEDKNGKSEVRDYIRELENSKNKEERIKFDKIIAYLRLLRQSGLSLREPYVKKIDKEIWELRPARDRILFASLQGNKFILLSYFMKKTQKTPINEIEKARKLLKNYLIKGDK